MKKLIAVSALFAMGALGMACGGAGTVSNTAANAANTVANKAGNAANTAANAVGNGVNTVANAVSNANAAATSKTQIGVASCDEYLTKMDEYLANPKVPEAVRTAQKDAKEKFVTAWKTAASTPEGKAGLETGCKAALDSLKNLPKF